MTTANVSRILPHLRRAAGQHETALPDEELLRRYLSGRDQAAFAALVQRHGAMVFAVSQSVLRQRHDAEDVFQTAFLILARKAGTIRRSGGVACWLHRVAYRLALKARANSARRQAREAKAVPPATAESAGDALTWAELHAILHAELAGLPERFRGPLVLCYLEGLTQDEAAKRLGWTAATVKGRLQRGREMLRRRLERRGVALTAVLGAALTGQSLAAPVSAALVETTLRAAGPAVGETPSLAAPLAGGLLRPRVPARAALSAVLLVVGLAWGVGMLPPMPEGGEPAASERPAHGQIQRTDLYGDPLPEGALVRLGSLRLRHAGLSDFVLPPNGKTILSAGGSVVCSWDLATGRPVREIRLQGPAAPGLHGSLAPDGKLLVKLHNNKLVVWETDSGKEIKQLPVEKEDWSSLYFSPDGKTVIALTWKPAVLLWDWKKGTQRRIALPARRIGQDSTFHSCVSPDSKYLAAGGGAGELLCVYELATGQELHRLRCHAGTSTFAPDGKRLVVSSMYNDKEGREAVIRVFELATGKQAAQYPLGHEYSFLSLTFAPDGKTLACGFSDRSCLLDCTNGRVLQRLPDRPIVMAFSPDGKTLVANMGHRFRLWDVTTGKTLQNRPGDFGWGPVLAVSPDGKLLAEADWLDQSVSLWDSTTGRLLRLLPLKEGRQRRYVRNLAFSPDGKTLVAGQMEGFLHFWDVATGKVQRTVRLTDPTRPNKDWIYFFQLHVSPDGKRVSTLEQFFEGKETTRLALWDTATGKLLSRHSLPAQSKACAWSADGQTVALPQPDGVKLMEIETGMVRWRIPDTAGDGRLAASPDERLLATQTPAGAVAIWATVTGKEIVKVAAGPVSHLALTPDNRHLVTVHDNLLRVWDLATAKERRRWSLPASASRFLLSPDGRRAFTALADGTALVWDLAPALRCGPRTEKPEEAKLTAWWADLAADDARRAYAAIWRLSEAPEATVPFLRRRLRPPTDAEIKEVRRHITDLDSTRFATRERAFERLLQLGEMVEPVLRHALEKNPSLELHRRIQLLLTRLAQRPPSSDALRTLRALEVLEHAGTEGQRLLRELAGGVEEACLTREARASLNRLARRSP